MTPEHTGRVCAQLLGLGWKRYGAPFDGPGPWISWRNDKAEITIPHIEGARVYIVDTPTLMLAAALRHAGSLDVGPCSACGGTCVQWARQQTPLELGQAQSTADYLSERGWDARVLDLDRVAYDNPRGPWAGRPAYQLWLVVGSRPCPACTVDGEPTGRERVPAWRAVLMGAPRECAECRSFGDMADDSEGCDACGGAGPTIPGHEGAREVLAQLAEGWRDWLDKLPPTRGEAMPDEREAVWGDWLRDQGQDYIADCPPRAAWVLAWLAGECPECSWKTGPMQFDRREDARHWCRVNRHPLKMVTQIRTSGDWGLWLSGAGRWANWGDVKERKPCACAKTGLAIESHLTAAWARGPSIRPSP